ncbi:transferrin-binding protein-like solute binding protein, partial [Caulobacter sp.]|uniref:transferrin-binding protein-like solute binding protein n=1 Tax=Caulobacter sp. TaxID=78 RepID=UPI003BB1368C
ALPTPPGPPAGSSPWAAVWVGPTVAVTAGAGTTTVRRIDNAVSNISVVYDSQGTPGTVDDRYTVRYGPDGYERSFSGLAASGDVYGTYRVATQVVGGQGEAFYVLDISNAFANSLDYVQMVSFERDVSATQVQLAYLTVGPQTPRASMPTTGTARFEGQTRGLLGNTNSLYGTTSDIEMTANFASGALSGSTSNFRNHSLSGNPANSLGNDPSFTFTASITSGTANFSGTAFAKFDAPLVPGSGGPGLSGTVQGGFFGPNADEVGLSYDLNMSTSSAWMQGAAVMGRKP